MQHVQNKVFIVIPIVFSLFVFSCTKSVGNRFEVSDNALSFTHEGGEKGFIINSSSPWTIVASEPWCKPVPPSGSSTLENGNSVFLTCPVNSGRERSCIVTVSNGSEEKVITVTQAHADKVLIVPEKTIFASPQQTNVVIEYSSDTAVKAVSGSPWITVSSIDGGSGRIICSTTPMEGDNSPRRVGEVSISNDYESKTVSVIQGNGPFGPTLCNALLKQYDTNHDGYLSDSEAESVYAIDLDYMYLESLDVVLDAVFTGFDYFPNMSSLTIGKVGSNHFPDIIIKDCPHLKQIKFRYIDPSSIIIENCPELQSIDSESCAMLKSTTISNCAMLESISFTNIQQSPGTTISIGRCASLHTIRMSALSFDCSEMDFSDLPGLSSLDVSMNYGTIKCVDLCGSKALKKVVLKNKLGGRIYSLILNSEVKGKCELQCKDTNVYYL